MLTDGTLQHPDKASRVRPGDSEPPKIISPFMLQRKWVLGAFGVTLLLACLIFFALPWQFRAVASIGAANPAGARRAEGASSADAASVVKLRLASADLVARTVDALGLAAMPDFAGPADSARTTAGRRGAAIASVQQGLSFHAAGESAVTVGLATADRRMAVRVLDDLLGRYVTTAGDADAASPAGLQRRIAAAKADFDARVARADQARETIANQEREAARAAAESEAQSAALIAEQTAVQDEAAAAAAVATAGASGTVASPTSPVLRGLIVDQSLAAAQLRQLGQQFGPLHPQMIAAEQRLADISLRISAEMASTSALLAAAQAARQRVAALGVRAAALNPATVPPATPAATLPPGVPAAPAAAPPPDVALLDREAAAAGDRYRLALATLRRPDLPTRRSFRILEAAQASPLPSAPDPLLFAMGSLIVAGAIAAATLWLRERREKGFRSPGQVAEGLALPVVALVPDLPADDRAGQERRRPIDVLGSDPDFAVAFDRLIVDLRARGPQCVAICSAVPNEGKTTVSICLARSAALAGLRVVLVDCDGRRRELSSLVGACAPAGLVQLIQGTAKLDVALACDPGSDARVILHSTTERVETELFATADDAHALLSELRGRFDLVILDTAPVLALEETRMLARLSDAVVLVARWRRTPVGATRIARDLLVKAKASIAGVALTRVRFA